MSGHVYYRFKSQKDPQRITFDGVGISVFDLKREIILSSKMGKGSDFDFAIYNADSEEEYKNDHTVIPRSSTVIARRLPPKRPGQGNAQLYIADFVSGPLKAMPAAHVDWRGGGAIVKDFRQAQPPPKVDFSALTKSGGERDAEAESMAAMFAQQEQQWQQTQETMATAARVGRQPGFKDSRPPRPGGNGDRPAKRDNSLIPQSAPPVGYICYRCGQKGHWIQECPTNDNPEFEGRPRIKRTTGIPKSFLQKVEGKPEDGQNVMVTADGSFVIARPDDASWQQHKAVVVKNLSAADILNLQPSDPDLACSICTKLLKEAVRTPCCQSFFCKDCITVHLEEHNGVCPECESKVTGGASDLVPDEERRIRSKDYIDDLVRASKAAAAEDGEGSGTEEREAEATDNGNEIFRKGGDEESAVPCQVTPTQPEKPAPLAPLESPANEETSSLTPNGDAVLDGASANRATSEAPVGSASPSAALKTPYTAGEEPSNNTKGIGQDDLSRYQDNQAQNVGTAGGIGTGMSMGMGNGFNPQQQQQQMMMMMQNPQIIQASLMQTTMMLQNTALPPPMRMQLLAQQQQLQMAWMNLMGGGGAQTNGPIFNQVQQPPHFHQGGEVAQGIRGGARGGYGGGATRGRFNLSDFQQRLQQQGVQIPAHAVAPPTTDEGPYQRVAANGRRAPAVKRGRAEDFVELPTGEKVPRYY